MNSPALRKLALKLAHPNIGVLPVVFFAFKAWQYRYPGQWPNMLWWCTVSNLVLGLAILFQNVRFIWIASLMLLVGIPAWFLDIAATGDFSFYSALTHIVSPALGLNMAFLLPRPRWIFLQGVGYYASLMTAARFATPRELNVNLAHDVYIAARPFISNFFLYTAMNTVILIGVLYLLEKTFVRWIHGNER